jgi:hypothetical protein
MRVRYESILLKIWADQQLLVKASHTEIEENLFNSIGADTRSHRQVIRHDLRVLLSFLTSQRTRKS